MSGSAEASSGAALNGAHVVIVGAGIAGLTAAIALRRIGYGVTIIEQAAQLSEIGAGLQLSPNATRLLATLGLEDALSAIWHEPARIALISGTDLREITHIPAGAAARRRWGAPYAVIHRGDLQRALLEKVEALDAVTLTTGTTASPDAMAAIAAARGGAPALVVGADGVWSAMRPAVGARADAPFAGEIAWRMSIDARDAADIFDADQLTAFLGPGTHLVAYPLKARGIVNLVAVTKGTARVVGWNAQAEDMPAILRASYRQWSPRLTALFDRATPMGRFPIHRVEHGPWQSGHTVLIGDAAHAMPPYAAQGAAMAIEDACGLAWCLARAGGRIAPALARFEAIRKPRIDKVRRRATLNRFAYHARGPFRLGRDVLLALRKPEDVAGDFDWLYGDRTFD